jgi:2-polyprenyl-6-methoxyphenol hydroxylase-like FAD-dependent oxidoreductase
MVFPQRDQRARLYTSTATDQPARYSGRHGRVRFLEDFGDMTCMPLARSLSTSTPIGPCATFEADEAWMDIPLIEGVVLIGDAAGHNNPIIGQGISLALRDCRILSELLFAEDAWSPERFMAYSEECHERLRRVRIGAALIATLFATFDFEAAQRRERFMTRRRYQTLQVEPLLKCLDLGPDSAPGWALSTEALADALARRQRLRTVGAIVAIGPSATHTLGSQPLSASYRQRIAGSQVNRPPDLRP